MVKKYDYMLSRFHTIPACYGYGRTDRQTDRQTDIAISISRVSLLTRDKNHIVLDDSRNDMLQSSCGILPSAGINLLSRVYTRVIVGNMCHVAVNMLHVYRQQNCCQFVARLLLYTGIQVDRDIK